MSPRVTKSKCLICGSEISRIGRYAKKTCSLVCLDEFKRRPRIGLTPEYLARIASLGRKSIKIAQAAHRHHPRTGPFETHHEAKEWNLIDPEGTRHEIRNLKKFCRENFGEAATRYATGIYRHSRWLKGLTDGHYPDYKGWRLVDSIR